jgi:bloom syndrome protein
MSECILFWGNEDFQTHYQMIISAKPPYTKEQKERKLENLSRMRLFTTNDVDCRRTQVLSYFQENFDSRDCNKTCDNCLNRGRMITKTEDVTEIAISLLKIVKEISEGHFTGRHVIDVIKGSKNKSVRLDVFYIYELVQLVQQVVEAGHDELEEHGKAASMSVGDLERILALMQKDNYLAIKTIAKGQYYHNYVFVSSIQSFT